MKKKRLPVCTMCKYKLEDTGKYLPVWFAKDFHIMLEHLPGTLFYFCPKCGTSSFSKRFKKKEPFWITSKQLRAKSAERVMQLREIYGT